MPYPDDMSQRDLDRLDAQSSGYCTCDSLRRDRYAYLIATLGDELAVQDAMEAEEADHEATVTCPDCLEAAITEGAYWDWVDRSIDEARGK